MQTYYDHIPQWHGFPASARPSIKANHIEQSAMAAAIFAEFIPAIVWERPADHSHAA